MDRQASTCNTEVVKRRDMTSRRQTLPCWQRGKVDRGKNILARLQLSSFQNYFLKVLSSEMDLAEIRFIQ